MGALVSTIGGWLQSGYELAVRSVKWIWESVCSLFGQVTKLVKDLFGKVMSCFSYTRERTWVQCDPNRVEVGSDRLSVGTQAPMQLPSDPVERNQMRNEVERGEEIARHAVEFFQNMKHIMDEDEEHANQQETAQKLRHLENMRCTQNLRAVLDNQPCVNPGLA